MQNISCSRQQTARLAGTTGKRQTGARVRTTSSAYPYQKRQAPAKYTSASTETGPVLRKWPLQVSRGFAKPDREWRDGFIVRTSAQVEPTVVNPQDPGPLVDELLEKIKDSDSGADLSPEETDQCDALLDQLEAIGDATQTPLEDDPLLWGDYEVAYSSSGKNQKGAPAGGRFRGKLGKMLFRTTKLEQNLAAPDQVVNKVGFLFLGLVPGEVELTGTVEPTGSAGAKFQPSHTVKAQFDPPRIRLGPARFSVGPKSAVVLKTTYLDDRVRLGRGSRGSLFVFTRLPPAAERAPAEVGSQFQGRQAVSLPGAALATLALLAAAWAAYIKAGPIAVACAAVVAALGIFGVLRNGGIVDEDQSAKMYQDPNYAPPPLKDR